MKRLFNLLLLAILACSLAFAQKNLTPAQLLERLEIRVDSIGSNADTIVTSASGLPVHVVVTEGEPRHVGQYLIPPASRPFFDVSVIAMAEGAALDQALNLRQPRYSDVKLSQQFFRALSGKAEEAEISYETTDKGHHLLSFSLPGGEEAVIDMKIDYLSLSGKTRRETEQDFIDLLKDFNLRETDSVAIPEFSPEQVKEHGSDAYYVPGKILHIPEINRNFYFQYTPEGAIKAISSPEYPAETLANSAILDGLSADPALKLRILTHTYGEVVEMPSSLQRFVALAKEQGCVPYFGLERFDEQGLAATVLLQNPAVGYMHVLALEGPAKAVTGEGELTARASLFIPTDNIADMHRERRERKKPIKIRIEK